MSVFSPYIRFVSFSHNQRPGVLHRFILPIICEDWRVQNMNGRFQLTLGVLRLASSFQVALCSPDTAYVTLVLKVFQINDRHQAVGNRSGR